MSSVAMIAEYWRPSSHATITPETLNEWAKKHAAISVFSSFFIC